MYLAYKYKFFEKIIGRAGEYWVGKELKKLSSNKYLILKDVFLDINTRKAQIDYIIVSD